MNYPVKENAVGALYRFRVPDLAVPAAWDNYNFIDSAREEVHGWTTIMTKSEKPLIGETEEQPPPYHYHFLFRRSSFADRFLLLTSHLDLIDHFIECIGWKALIVTASIKVQDLVKDMTEKPTHYCLGAVQARVDGYGRSLRSMSLYGMDLADAQLFRDILPKLVPYYVHLHDVRTGDEVIRVGNQGKIKFTYNGKESLHEVDKALHYLSKHGYLQWE